MTPVMRSTDELRTREEIPRIIIDIINAPVAVSDCGSGGESCDGGCDGCAGTCACADSQNVRVCEWIAKKCLHLCSANRESAAGDDCRQDARNPDLPDYCQCWIAICCRAC